MQLKFELFQKDYTAFTKAQYWNGKVKILYSAIIIVACYFFGPLVRDWTNFDFNVTMTLFIVAAILILLFFLFVGRILPKNKKPLDCLNVILTKGGVIIRGNDHVSHYHWSQILRMKESPLHFFLYISRNQAIIFPKRALLNNDEIGTFRKVVTERIDELSTYEPQFMI